MHVCSGYMCVCLCMCLQFGAVVKGLIGLPILGVGGSNPGLGLATVTLSKSLYPYCFSQPICKTGIWPCAGVDMTIDHENMAVAHVE